MAHVADIDLRAMACVLHHGGHVMIKIPRAKERTCRYCQRPYGQVLDSTDPFVHIYNPYDITIRPVPVKDIQCYKGLMDLPNWYVERHGRY